MKDEKCPFCMVDSKLLIEETQYNIVLINLLQVARGDAVLIVPKTHVKSISDLSDLEYQDFCVCIKRVHGRLLQAGETKFNILINEGLLAGQMVPHLHAHVFSRQEKDGIKNMVRKNRKNIFEDWKPQKTQAFLERLRGYFA